MTCISKRCESLPAEVCSVEQQERHYCNQFTFYSNGRIDLAQLPVSVSLRFWRKTDIGGGEEGGGWWWWWLCRGGDWRRVAEKEEEGRGWIERSRHWSLARLMSDLPPNLCVFLPTIDPCSLLYNPWVDVIWTTIKQPALAAGCWCNYSILLLISPKGQQGLAHTMPRYEIIKCKLDEAILKAQCIGILNSLARSYLFYYYYFSQHFERFQSQRVELENK